MTGFYGLTTMPTEFQRIMDLTLAGITNTFVFIDDILIVTHGTEDEHIKKVKEVMQRLDNSNINLKLGKLNFAAKNIEWVRYNLSQQGVAPINSKVQGISERLRPTNLKQLRSFLGAVNQFNKFIPDLAKLCFPFRTLLKKDNEWNWNTEQENAFTAVNEAIKKATTLNHFKRNCPLRIICDASKSGLGAVLQQEENGTWKPISFASRFLTELESKYSINELELLAIVWSVEYFRSYVYGVPFKIISDHKALATVLKGLKANKTYSSRLTRWVDRLLPYDFEVIHGPGRTLGIADYLSRNPSPLIENSVKSSTLWDEWFTVNIVSEMKNSILANEEPSRGGRQPIKSESDASEKTTSKGANDVTPLSIKQTIRDAFTDQQQLEMARKRDASETRKLHELAIKPPVKRPITLALIDKNSSTPLKSSIQRIGENMLAATYDCDPLLQSIIALLQTFDQKKFNKLPKIWQQRYKELRLDENNFIYIDERLVIPEELRRPIFRSLHWGHPGRDTMLQAVADIWWPRIHREIVLLAQSCSRCQKAGKNLKTIQKQSEYGKLPAAKTHNDEIAIDFAGPFKLAPKAKKYLLVSIDHKTNWPNAAFVKKPTAETVVNFLNAHIAQFGIPKRIRTDPATIFRGETFKQFCSDHFIKHIECPIRDHRGNGKIERLIRTLNERLRADKTIITERGNTGLARLLFALRTAAAANKTSPFEQVFGRKPNTIKEITEKPKNCLENEETLQLSPEDFPKDDDSTIFLRDRTKNTKLEGQFKKRHGSIVAESNHTITLQNNRGRQVISKRDIAKQKSTSYSPKTRNQQNKGGNSHSLERKIAALKDAETREEMELNKPLKAFIKRKEKQTETRTKSPRKQARPRKSLAGLPEKKSEQKQNEILDSSSDEEENTMWQETTTKQDTTNKPEETTEEKQEQPETSSNNSRQSQRTKRKPNWFGQNVMVTKIDTKDNENKNNAQTNKEIEQELEAIPDFEAMTQEEIDHWVNN